MPSGSEQPFFSVVAPCCEVERYLDEMVESLVAQPFADWECVLSYEDSKDATRARCEAALDRDRRFRLVEGPRSGSPSTPRNRGLAAARGRYVVWLDGDDWLADDALGRLAAAIRAHGEPEAVQGGATEVIEDERGVRTFGARHFNFEPADDGRVLSGLDVLERFAEMPRFAMPMASLTVVRRDFLLERGLTFADGLKYEDNEWTPRVMTFATSVLVAGFDVYVYRRRAGSITTADGAAATFRQKAEMLRRLFLFFASAEAGMSASMRRVWAKTYVSFFFDEAFREASGVSGREWTRGMRIALGAGGRRAFLALVWDASLVKKAVAPLVLACGACPLLDLPARAFFRFVYHPLVMRRFHRSASA